ncbi:MAG: DUF935 family protein [Thermodesulfobacteriota bacterium]|nr:DUF935 family protein [Thermodesulfobacteriota bacterium]
MTEGIWLSNDMFYEFSENNRALFAEMATHETATGFDPATMLGYLPDPDPVLIKHGGGHEVLENLMGDDQVTLAYQSRKLHTLENLDYEFTAGAPDGKKPDGRAVAARDALADDLAGVNMYNLIAEVLGAPFFGYTPVELIWEPGDGRVRLVDLVAKPREWFSFADKVEPKFMRMGVAEAIPYGKFVFARHFPTYKNPYGLRLLTRCLWPVAFKKGGIGFWSKFCEKFGIPWVVGKARQGAQKSERKEMRNSLAAMVQDAVAVVTAGSEVEIHETTGKAGDLHKAFVERWDAAISKVLMGQTLTAEIGEKGSYAASKTHENVLESYASADRTLVKAFFDALSRVYTRINFGDKTAAPVFAFVRQEDAKENAELSGKLHTAGVRFKKTFFVRRCGLAEDEFEMTDEKSAGGAFVLPAGGAIYAEEDDDDLTGQDELDAMVDDVLADAGTVTEEMVNTIKDIIDRAESFDDLSLLLAEEMGSLGVEELQELMSRALVAADIWGRFSVKTEVEKDSDG